MRIVDIIEKKRDNHALTKEEIDFLIKEYVDGRCPDYQMSAFLMATYFNSMDLDEATLFTQAILDSGDVIDLSSVNGIKVDKHSTGGVGDKVSLILAPLLASCGLKMAKLSGRGLGHTGGTIDKLESIPGFNVSLSEEKFLQQVRDINIALGGQTKSLCPADKMLYALRDVTATVNSIPLIASSIMSKKLASGADIIALDVKVGNGAFMKTIEDATELARYMVEIGRKSGKKVVAFLTNMEQPLGDAVGNSLEVVESIDVLHGKGPKDITDLIYQLSEQILVLAGLCHTETEARALVDKQIHNGEAYAKFLEFIRVQDGDVSVLEDLTSFTHVNEVIEVKATTSGTVEYLDALEIGIASMKLGAGRETKEDEIDFKVGVVLQKKIGDTVNTGDTLVKVYNNGRFNEEIKKQLLNAYKIGSNARTSELIYKVIK